jgi:hypothetical protein
MIIKNILTLKEQIISAWSHFLPPTKEDLLGDHLGPEVDHIVPLLLGKSINQIDLSNRLFAGEYYFCFIDYKGICYYIAPYMLFTLDILLNKENHPFGCIDVPVHHLIDTLSSHSKKRKGKLVNLLRREQIECIHSFLKLISNEYKFFCIDNKRQNEIIIAIDFYAEQLSCKK